MANFKEVKKVLHANGWVECSSIGSHHQFYHSGNNRTATVPNHGSKDIPSHAIDSLNRKTGLSLRR